MSKKNKIEMKMVFDHVDLLRGMKMFFDQYAEQLPSFLKDALAKANIDSDPSVIVKDDEIRFSMVNTNKGAVVVYSDDKQENFRTIDYKLVPNDDKYIMYLNGQLMFFFKRGGKADDQIGVFPTLEAALIGLKQVEDPIEVQKRIEAMDVRDAHMLPAATEEVSGVEVVEEEGKSNGQAEVKGKLTAVK